MAYIYRYVNKKNGITEYVGIITKESNFPRRFEQHKRDPWYEFGKYDIYYAVVESQTDAEALEGHFIAEYESYDYHNKAKINWGKCSFAPNVKWEKYDPAELQIKRGSKNLDARWEYAFKRLSCIDSEIIRIQDEYSRVYNEIADCRKGYERLRRASVRQWFSSVLVVVYYPTEGKCASSEFLFKSYCDYIENIDEDERQFSDKLLSDEIYEFEDINEFWDTMLEVPEFRNVIRGNTMYSLMLKADFQQMIFDQTDSIIDGLRSFTKKES